MQTTTTVKAKRSWVRYVLLALAALILALVSAAGWFLLDDNRVRVALEKGVTTLSDRPFHIDGDFAISFGRITTVSGSDVRWLNPAWSKQPDMLSARKLSLSIDLWSLVRGPIVISNAQADDATLVFEWSKEGQFNWNMGKSSSDEGSGPLRLVLGQTELRNVQIRARHPGMTDELVVDVVQASQRQDAADMLQISADAVIDERSLKARGRVGHFQQLVAGGAIDYHFDLEAPTGSLKASGHLDRLSDPRAPRMNFDLFAADAADVLRGLELPELTTGNIELHAAVTPVGEHLDGMVKGNFGAFKLDGKMTTTSLSSLDDFSLLLLSDGPGVAAFGSLLGVDGLPDEAYSLQVDASRSGQELQVRQFSYLSDGLRIKASGAAHSLPALAHLDLDIDAKVANLQSFGKLFSLPSLPSLPKLPLSIKASVQRKGAGGRDELQGDFALGNIAGEVSGKLSEKKDLTGSIFSYLASSPDLRELARARGIRVPDQGAFPGRMDGELVLLSERLRMARLAVNIADNHLTASGEVDFRPTDALVELHPQLRGPDLYKLARLFLDEEEALYFPAGPYQLGGKLTLQGPRLRFASQDAQAGNSVIGFDGWLDFAQKTPRVDARVSAKGGSLAALLKPEILEGVPATAFSLSTGLKMSDQGMALNDLQFSLADSTLTGWLSTGWPREPERLAFDLIAAGSDLRASLPAIPGYVAAPVAFRVEAKGTADPASVEIERLDGSFADASIALAGKLVLKPALSADAVRLSAQGPKLSELGRLTAWPPVDLPFAVSGTMTGSKDSLQMDDFQASLGKSDLKGSMRINTTARPRIDLDVRSDYLGFQQLLTLEEAPAIKASNATEAGEAKATKSDDKSGRLFSDKALPLEVLRSFDGKLLASLATVEARRQQLHDVHAAATLQDGLLVVKKLQGQARRGKVAANFTLDVRGKQPAVEGQFEASDATFFILGTPKEEEAKLPQHTIESHFSASGNSISALAAGLDGYLWLRSSPGQFRSLHMDVLFGDFAFQLFSTLNPFAKKNPYTTLNCAGVYLEASKGRVETAPAVVFQTDRLSVVARGSIDLRSEKIDFGFKVVPLQGVGLSAGDLIKPFIKLGGTLTAPALDLNVVKGAFDGGVAVATLGASLLVESLWDRWINSPGACAKIEEEARKLRLSRREKPVPGF